MSRYDERRRRVRRNGVRACDKSRTTGATGATAEGDDTPDGTRRQGECEFTPPQKWLSTTNYDYYHVGHSTTGLAPRSSGASNHVNNDILIAAITSCIRSTGPDVRTR